MRAMRVVKKRTTGHFADGRGVCLRSFSEDLGWTGNRNNLGQGQAAGLTELILADEAILFRVPGGICGCW